MFSRQEFNELVLDAYNHLYDLVYLRTHPLSRLGENATEQSAKENAWQFHNLLIQTIQELNPGPQAPVNSAEWRRFRIMELRFLNGLEPQIVAEQLFISRRQFYRELAQSIETCADLLSPRYEIKAVEDAAGTPEPAGESGPSQTRLELLRIEAAQFHHSNRSAKVNEIINNVLDVVDEPATRQGTSIRRDLNEYLPAARIDQSILRQIVFGLFNLLLPFAAAPGIQVSTMHSHDEVLMTCSAALNVPAETMRQKNGEELGILMELVELNAARLQVIDRQPQAVDIILGLPGAVQRTVLLADDNADIRRLIASYLRSGYTVIEALTGTEAIRLAHEVHPFVILLDLMMPDRDGWDVLQALKNDTQTQSIPIVICSVLGMKELALSMGASSFLTKPVSEKELQSTLDCLGG